mgnify:CR=1 FL=1
MTGSTLDAEGVSRSTQKSPTTRWNLQKSEIISPSPIPEKTGTFTRWIMAGRTITIGMTKLTFPRQSYLPEHKVTLRGE